MCTKPMHLGMLIYITSPQIIAQVYSDQTHLVNPLLNLHFSILDRSVNGKDNERRAEPTGGTTANTALHFTSNALMRNNFI